MCESLPLLCSSHEALDLLKAGLVHVAGIHLTDRERRHDCETTVLCRSQRHRRCGGLWLVVVRDRRVGLRQQFEVTHTDAEWRKLLTPDQYAVLRQRRPSARSPARCCTRSGAAPSPAPAASSTCSRRRRSSRVAPAGRASGRRSRRPSSTRETPRWAWSGRRALPPLRRPSRPCVR